MNTLRVILGGIISTVLTVQLLLVSSVSAAGSAVVTVEISPSSTTTSSNISLRFYVTPSGAGLYSAQFNVNLSNLTYVSYSASGTVFSGLNTITSGGSAGSTSFQVVASHSGSNSSSSKAYIGQVTARTASNAGTGTISISGVEAYDSTLDGMSASGQNGSMTITAPVVTNPSPGGGSGGGTPAPSTPTGNVTETPNPDSTVGIPSSDGSSEPEVVPEVELAEALDENADTVTETTETKESVSFDFKKIAMIALPVIAVLLVGFAGYRIWDFRRNSKFHAPVSLPEDPLAPTVSSASTISPAPPSSQPPVTPPTSNPQITTPTPPHTQGPVSQEPVIITPDTPPTQQTNGSNPDGTKV